MSAECYNNKEVDRAKSRLGVSRGGTIVRFFVAAVLLLAAGLKAYQLATVPFLGEGILHARWFNILIVNFELFFGIWLVYGLLPQWTNRAATSLFCLFAVVSFYKAISGETSCGCFGSVTVNPWITMTFDLFIVFVMWVCRPKQETQSGNLAAMIGSIFISWLVLAVPLTWIAVTYEPAVLTKSGEIVGSSQSVLLNPRDWIDEKFPLLQFVDIPVELGEGTWCVLLYRKSCADCRKQFERRRDRKISVEDERGIVFLETGGYTQNELKKTFDDGIGHWGCLKPVHHWFIETPVMFKLRDGVVEGVDTYK
ncbi:hypothetical protein FACS189443_4280 [Planctomycetales bacterium]|nr:hypothetical protein FACS189443_4280 [Planctomycetales bacterium]